MEDRGDFLSFLFWVWLIKMLTLTLLVGVYELTGFSGDKLKCFVFGMRIVSVLGSASRQGSNSET